MRRERKFVFYRVTNPATGETREDNMNLWEWEQLQRQSRKQYFEFIRMVDLDNPKDSTVPVALDGKQMDVPIIKDELECPLCGFVALDEAELKAHKKAEHGKKESLVSSEAKSESGSPAESA